MEEHFSSPKEERLILSGLIQYGRDLYFELDNILNDQCFRKDLNRVIYRCIEKVLENESSLVDFPTIECAAETLGLTSYFARPENYEYLLALGDDKVNIENCINAAKKIRKLSIAKNVYDNLEEAQQEYLKVNGEETAEKIISIGHEAVFKIDAVEETNAVKVTTGMREYFRRLQENENKQIGISTGFKKWDAAVGGGLRPGSVTVWGARLKTGKSMVANNICYHVSSMDIPTLLLDTEMSREEVMVRLASRISNVEINTIESGRFSNNQEQKDALIQAYRKMDTLPYFHKNVAGFEFNEILTSIRSWLIKNVGFNTEGKANKCLVVLDYLKLMSSSSISKNMAEFQLLGMMMNSLTAMAQHYQFPCLTFVQLNRDGINSEETSVISGSDRIGWLCSSFTIFKKKDETEIGKDGPAAGNRKIIPVVCRHGEGLPDGCYINCKMEGRIGKVTEGKTNFEIQEERKLLENTENQEGEEIKDESESPQF